MQSEAQLSKILDIDVTKLVFPILSRKSSNIESIQNLRKFRLTDPYFLFQGREGIFFPPIKRLRLIFVAALVP